MDESPAGSTDSHIDDLKAVVEESMRRFKEARDREVAEAVAYFAKFQHDLSNEDLTGALIRGHLYVENEMAKILSNVVPLYEKIPTRQLMFESKVIWLRALGLISGEERKALEVLNNIRNKLAHVSAPGAIPELTTQQIIDLRSALSSSMLLGLSGKERNATDEKVILRSSITMIVITLYVLSEVTESEFGVADVVRYQLTGQTVQERVDSARRLSDSDDAPLKTAKELVDNLRYEDRDALRVWMREVYHY